MPKSSNEHDRYVLHLNQALAMESALVDHLEKRAAAVPDAKVRERILQHRDETIQHRETVRDCIQGLGGEPTATKAVVQPPVEPGLIGKVMTALESEKEDRLLSEDLADYAVEHYEAALYSGLAPAANDTPSWYGAPTTSWMAIVALKATSAVPKESWYVCAAGSVIYRSVKRTLPFDELSIVIPPMWVTG